MSRLSLFLPVLLASAVGLTVSSCSTLFPGNRPSTETGPTTGGGCTDTTKHVAPGGHYVVGNTVYTADGHAHLLQGVDRPSLEWPSGGDHISLADFQAMAGWKANTVRIALNQDFWLEGSKYYDPSYPSPVDSAVHWAPTVAARPTPASEASDG